MGTFKKYDYKMSKFEGEIGFSNAKKRKTILDIYKRSTHPDLILYIKSCETFSQKILNMNSKVIRKRKIYRVGQK